LCGMGVVPAGRRTGAATHLLRENHGA
jgi:hypothetical protein